MRISIRQQNAEQLFPPAGIIGSDRQDASWKALALSPTVSRKGVGSAKA
jgi:hypothetical protein